MGISPFQGLLGYHHFPYDVLTCFLFMGHEQLFWFGIWIIAGWMSWLHHIIEISIDDASGSNLSPFCIQISTQRYKKGTTKHSSLGMVISQCSVARIGSPDLNPSDLALPFHEKGSEELPPNKRSTNLGWWIMSFWPFHETWKYTGGPKKIEFNLLASCWCQLFISRDL